MRRPHARIIPLPLPHMPGSSYCVCLFNGRNQWESISGAMSKEDAQRKARSMERRALKEWRKKRQALFRRKLRRYTEQMNVEHSELNAMGYTIKPNRKDTR